MALVLAANPLADRHYDNLLYAHIAKVPWHIKYTVKFQISTVICREVTTYMPKLRS
jgi:hypothetical protein